MAAKCILKKNQGIYYGAFLSLINAAVTIILFLTGNFPGLNARFFQGNAWQQQGNLPGFLSIENEACPPIRNRRRSVGFPRSIESGPFCPTCTGGGPGWGSQCCSKEVSDFRGLPVPSARFQRKTLQPGILGQVLDFAWSLGFLLASQKCRAETRRLCLTSGLHVLAFQLENTTGPLNQSPRFLQEGCSEDLGERFVHCKVP